LNGVSNLVHPQTLYISRRCKTVPVVIIHCVQKKTPTHIFFHISMNYFIDMDLNKNCSEYTQGLIDSDNVKIRYSLRSMT